MFTRKIEYNPTEEQKKKWLKYDYSRAKKKIIKEYWEWFIRVNDYPYDWFEKHYMIVPKFWNQKIEISQRIELFAIRKERSKEWYFVILNPENKQSITKIYHEHLIKLP